MPDTASTTQALSGRRVAPIQVKICGLTRVEDAAHAEARGASYLGAILAGGPRRLSLDVARLVLGPRRQSIQRVSVFGDQTVEEMMSAAEYLDLDVLQLHGGLAPVTEPGLDALAVAIERLRRETGRRVWPVVRVAGQTLPKGTAVVAQAAEALVLDAHVVGQLGGTGVPLDWSGLREAVAQLRREVPSLTLILAGGLRPENVGTAIRLLSPDIVDVSSGVETAPGVKDPERVEQFVTAALREKAAQMAFVTSAAPGDDRLGSR